MSAEKKIESLQKDGLIFNPDASMQPQAWIRSMDDYHAAHKRALEDPDGYWGERAKELITWFKSIHVTAKAKACHWSRFNLNSP